IVVDNNSSDKSVDIITNFMDKLPIVLLHEPKQGKNAALNTGLSIARGDLIIFTDDDIIPNTDWLTNYEKLLKTHLDYDLFGGRVEPYWQTLPNKYLLRDIPLVIAYATRDESIPNGPCKAMTIFGPNMAVRKRVFEQGITFNENIGPSGKNYIMGSESDFLVRAESSGFRAYFVTALNVKHIVRPFQLTDAWLENRAFKAGRATLHKDITAGRKINRVKTWFGKPRWCVKKIMYLSFIYWLCRMFNLPQKYSILWRLYDTKGFSSEYKALLSMGEIR
ncbi:glycosyltransferase family 2 protein, partial [Paraglaciecola sp.]|uniref:glycosyltransferase family 2 protein n=1 Tax=Paraglaciecola sp. TaxID=1920173 RepID=UPI00273EEB9D